MLLEVVRRVSLLGLAAMLVTGVAWGWTSSNTVPATHLGRYTEAITPDKLKPAACSGITVTNLVVGSGIIPGTNGSDLILGSAQNDTLGSNGVGHGPDCCLGGGGTNTFRRSCTVSVP